MKIRIYFFENQKKKTYEWMRKIYDKMLFYLKSTDTFQWYYLRYEIMKISGRKYFVPSSHSKKVNIVKFINAVFSP